MITDSIEPVGIVGFDSSDELRHVLSEEFQCFSARIMEIGSPDCNDFQKFLRKLIEQLDQKLIRSAQLNASVLELVYNEVPDIPCDDDVRIASQCRFNNVAVFRIDNQIGRCWSATLGHRIREGLGECGEQAIDTRIIDRNSLRQSSPHLFEDSRSPANLKEFCRCASEEHISHRRRYERTCVEDCDYWRVEINLTIRGCQTLYPALTNDEDDHPVHDRGVVCTRERHSVERVGESRPVETVCLHDPAT